MLGTALLGRAAHHAHTHGSHTSFLYIHITGSSQGPCAPFGAQTSLERFLSRGREAEKGLV